MHPEAKAILARLACEKMTALYHFTNIENLPGICQAQALCSKQTLTIKGKQGIITGGNTLSHNLDRINDNWDKVSLSLTPHIPMAFYKKRELHLCFLVISPEVAGRHGVVFTDTNSAAKLKEQQRGYGAMGCMKKL